MLNCAPGSGHVEIEPKCELQRQLRSTRSTLTRPVRPLHFAVTATAASESVTAPAVEPLAIASAAEPAPTSASAAVAPEALLLLLLLGLSHGGAESAETRHRRGGRDERRARGHLPPKRLRGNAAAGHGRR